jgi:transposase-like protein
MANGNGRGTKRSRAWHRARWREHVEAWATSGMSAAAYCREHGVNPKSLYRWRGLFAASGELDCSKEASCDSNGVAAAPQFAELQLSPGSVPSTGTSSGVELVVSGDRRLRLATGFDAETLRRAVSVLESLPC